MLTLTNEFSTVIIKKIQTRNGERLPISAPRLGYSVGLDPRELEDLTCQPVETFSQLPATPFGSDEDGVEARPLSDLTLFGGKHG